MSSIPETTHEANRNDIPEPTPDHDSAPAPGLVELTDQSGLEAVLKSSEARPQLLFKHSLTCPISSAAHRAMIEYLDDTPADGVDYSLIVVQNARPVSSSVAERLGVRHESPQAILVKGGEAVWSASHWSITKKALSEALEDALNGPQS